MELRAGRQINIGQYVKVYYNLQKKTFSIADKKTGLVLGYSDIVNLREVTFHVSEKGRQRVLKEKQKNVHAFVVGFYNGTIQGPEESNAYYNPYKTSTFIDLDDKEELRQVESVTCINRQIKYKL